MKLHSLNIGTRLGLGLGAMMLVSTILLVLGFLVQERVHDATIEAARSADARATAATDMRQSLMAAAVAIRNMGLNAEIEGVQAAQAVAVRDRQAYLGQMRRLEGSDLADDQRALIGKLKEIDRRIEASFTEAVGLSSIFATEEAAKLITTQIDPASNEAMAVLASFIDLQHANAAAVAQQGVSARASVARWLMAGGVVGLAFAALVGWLLTRSIVAPIRQAVEVADQVATGDLRVGGVAHGSDETGRLLGSLHAMSAQLQGIVAQVRTSTDSIAIASAEIAGGSQDLASRTEQTASSLQHSSSALKALTDVVTQSSSSARQATQLASETADTAARGGEAVARVVGTMDEIQASSRKIADIISLIDGIAFQTNILALNAAVEAARAGEQGRGFAVVASEVRGLAQRSAHAAREIKTLIDDSVGRVDAGSEQVAQAGRTMEEIVGSVRKVNAIIGEMAEASARQSEGLGEVNEMVDQLDRMTQQNAALVEQSASAAETLKDQARHLAGLVATFKVD
ncbi:MAG: methyl-accepting chemotaxis protein [Lautropia sp.]